MRLGETYQVLWACRRFSEGGIVHQPVTDHSTGAEYDKKKYVWKLLYIFMLGYDVEFGHKQAADLIPATK